MTLTLPLSAAGRWVHCPGSVRLAASYPLDDPDPRRAEGTEAHRVAMALLTTGEIVEGATSEMIDGAQLFAAEVAKRLPDPESRRIERHVRASSIHPHAVGQPDVYGDADRVLYVFEYKYGHRKVEAFENWQCVAEAIAILDARGTDPRVDFVEVVVVQPRYYGSGGPVRTWRAELHEHYWMRGRLRTSAERVERDDAETLVGDYCRTCPARHACATLQAATADVADYAGTATPFALTAAQAARELTALRRASDGLDARISGLEIEVTAALRRGEGTPGWTLERGTGRECWKPDAAARVAAIATALGHDIHKPRELITPAQARKLGLPAAVIDRNTERPQGEAKLAPADTNLTRQIFGGNPQ